MSRGPVNTRRPFFKMHGAGNDFVVFDARDEPLRVTAARARALADRRTGIGCDQVIVMRPGQAGEVFMEIWNGDGGEVAACGNAARCVGRLLMEETGSARVTLETRAGLLAVRGAGEAVTVDMGRPSFDWRDIPLSEACDTLAVPLAQDSLSAPVAVSMGNPHAVFFVDEPDATQLARLGPELERHRLFPEGANMTVAAVEAGDRLRARVWERGAGLTQACGSAACAALAAARRRGLTGNAANVALPGGVLQVHWAADGRIHLTGPAETSFAGEIELEGDPAEAAA